MKESREIRQLWAMITSDLKSVDSLAIKCGTQMNLTSKKVATYFSTKMPSSSVAKDLNILSGTLSSVSIRLQTIAEIFEKRHNHIIFKDYRSEYDNNISVEKLKEKLVQNRALYMHQLLRDNVGHLEPLRKSKKKEVLYEARQKAIESLRIVDIKDSIVQIVKRFRVELKSCKVL